MFLVGRLNMQVNFMIKIGYVFWILRYIWKISWEGDQFIGNAHQWPSRPGNKDSPGVAAAILHEEVALLSNATTNLNCKSTQFINFWEYLQHIGKYAQETSKLRFFKLIHGFTLWCSHFLCSWMQVTETPSHISCTASIGENTAG